MQLGREQHRARVGRVPEDGLVFVVPGEDAAPVSEDQALGAEIAADGEQAIFFGELGRGEDQASIEAEDHSP